MNDADEVDPVITTSGIVSSINDGATSLGSVSANETVSWSVSGSGVSINSSGAVTLDSSADAGTAASHSFTVTATDSASNSSTSGTLTVSVNDTTAPVISLKGSSPITLQIGTAYSESGATAADNKDGDISGSISVDSSAVDVNKVGTYSVTYNVSDSAGNAATQVTRTVNIGADSTIPVITLLGDAEVTKAQGTGYTDAGATASDNYDGDITSSIWSEVISSLGSRALISSCVMKPRF